MNENINDQNVVYAFFILFLILSIAG